VANETSSSDKNAMARRLEHLANSLDVFIQETDKPLLRWLTEPGDDEIVRVFIEYEQEIGDLTSLVIETKVPFEADGDDFALRLMDDIERQYEEIKPGLAEEDIVLTWKRPAAVEGEDSTARLVRTLTHLYLAHSNIIAGVVLFIRPSAMLDEEAYALWMGELLRQGPPPEIRFVVLDPVRAPLLDDMATTDERSVLSEPMNLDYPGMLEELAHGEDNQQGPDAKFRVLFVRLSNQAEKQDIEGAEETARKALAVAASQNWYQMQVVVHMAMGACHLQQHSFEPALAAYKRATFTARQAKDAQDPAGPKMEVASLLAEGSVLFAMQDYPKAAEVYVEAAPLAESTNDPLLAMEAWRMAAYCNEVSGDYASSVRYGESALDAGEKLRKDQRALSTLAFVGDGMIRVLGTAKKKRKAKGLPETSSIEERMESLLDENWRDLLKTGTEGGKSS
jgi:tetratricopeptide (TPR) repeat protein